MLINVKFEDFELIRAALAASPDPKAQRLHNRLCDQREIQTFSDKKIDTTGYLD